MHVSEFQRILALSVGALLVLVSLPGHPPYYIAAASIVAKHQGSGRAANCPGRCQRKESAIDTGGSRTDLSSPHHKCSLSPLCRLAEPGRCRGRRKGLVRT